MRAFILAAALAAVLPAMPSRVWAQDAPPIGTIGPYEAVDSTPKQLLLMDRGSTDWVDGNLRIVFLVLKPGDGDKVDSYLLRIRADCKTYDMAQMEQTLLDADGNPVHSDMLDNVMKPTPDGSVGHEMATSACDGAPKTDDGQIISFDTLADATDFGRKFFAAQ